MAVVAGTRFDRYEILSPLGSGGMGEVYLARDTRLERKVALKLLPVERTRDDQRLLRFEQEAKAASALNHPNIITIYEIGDSDSVHFIATEYIDGRTLRQILADGKLSPLAAIDVAIQIASALSAAHEAGIIHRDIKPENVMLRHDGIIKVLDFGLAKLTEMRVEEAGTGAREKEKTRGWGAEETLHLPIQHPPALTTDPGIVMGTATYMSPEQTRGLRVDARTDIFSLGVTLYEMVAGHAPFSGATSADVMTQVLEREPRPLTSFSHGAPAELQRIVSKVLRKDREERYQTVKDLLLDLKSLKRELESTTTLTYNINSTTDGEMKAVIGYETAVIAAGGRVTSNAEYIVSGIQRHKRGALITLAALILFGAGLAAYFYDRGHTIDSIAVLPFLNQNEDATPGPNADPNASLKGGLNAELLSDSITDSIINNLSQLSNLNVKPRGAVLRYKNQEVDAREVARALDVHAVLTGRITRRGDSVQVSVALVDARDNRHLWGEQFTHKISDLLLLQQEIVGNVTDKLLLKLSGQEKRRMDAHQLYLKGRNAWRKRTAESIQEGARYLEQATQVDPTYAEAYAGLADCYNMLVNYSVSPGKDSFPKAKEAAEKALSLNENLAEAHAARAYIYFQWEWNWFESEREYKRAIELRPNYAPGRQWYSSLLAVTGRFEEALAEAARARELEPLSPVIASHPGWISYLARNSAVTMEEARQTLKLDPSFFPAQRYLALAYQLQGKNEEAVTEFQKAVALSRGSTLVKAELGHAYAVAGKRVEALQVIEELKQLTGQRHVSPFHFALIYTGLGEKDHAIEYLNKAFDERAERLVWLRADPRFDKLRADARFNDLLLRIGPAPRG